MQADAVPAYTQYCGSSRISFLRNANSSYGRDWKIFVKKIRAGDNKEKGYNDVPEIRPLLPLTFIDAP